MATFADAISTFRAIEIAADRGARLAADAMADRMTRAVQSELRAKSHPPHTKTPSLPFEPPAMISGDLARSMDITPAFPLGGGAWMSKTGPTVRYARIQELGGWMAGHPLMHWIEDGVQYYSTGHELPKRPYMRPEAERLVGDGQLTESASRAFGIVIRVVL